MKKITFLLGCLVATLGTVNAQDVQTSTVQRLMDRMANLENPLGAEPANLFTQEEKLLLQDHFNANNSENPIESLVAGDVYTAQIYGGCNEGGFGTFPLTGPYNINYITSIRSTFYAGDQDDSGNLYGVKSANMDQEAFLVKINPITGEETVIGQLNLESPHIITGIAWNTVNQTMYALSADVYVTRLYTIDLTTGTVTLIGETGNPRGIWLAIDNSGNGFMMDVGTDRLYSVDLATGAGTIIGSTGVDLSRAQDADFDPATNILYTGGYIGAGVSRFYSVDTTTGAYTDLGPVNYGCAQLGMITISGETAGISENSLKGFSFFPNPASDVLNLKSVSSIENVSVYNILGEQVINRKINASDSRLDISSLNTGVYILKVEVNGEVGSYRFVKN